MLFTAGRNLNSRSPHRRVGYISCPWFQSEQIQYESLLEMNFARIALLCPHLTNIASQPFKLNIGEDVFYTPDFQLTFRDGKKLIIEVKPTVFVSKHSEKLRQAETVLKQHNFGFLLVTDEQIYRDGRNERASTYIRYARSQYPSSEINRLKKLIFKVEYPLSIHSLKVQTGISQAQLLHLIGIRHLSLEPNLRGNELFLTNHSKWENTDGFISPEPWLGSQDW